MTSQTDHTTTTAPTNRSTAQFRFGLVAMPRPGLDWLELSRRVEALGFDSLLVPDNLDAVAPVVANAASAAVTERLSVGPYVIATPLRSPGHVAADAAALHQLSGGRVEMGLGAGRPDSKAEAERLGIPFGTPTERMSHLEQTITAVRARTPAVRVTVAASGPKMLALAGRTADVVALGASPFADEAEVARMGRVVTDAAAEAGRQVVLNTNLSAVGDDIPAWLEERMGLTVDKLLATGAASYLPGSPAEMAETLQRRRAVTGVSYVCAGVDNADRLAPVVELLKGR
ncbi:LLM class flavin-dependent oxidoreductase [Pedococcus bigeumensis]|uniref:LLM class flavin-dependent oxidoreductase n=1 Tax=Pedococcus bigeumensis TaxID=433644 RepID=A0A502D4J3_9MICO|nr:LLM class flavin-dependent oxidoreductase [Pedococcus bigeumensis]TPG19319.1 LLM class flavin-dependent oxidoreductase [Pedococcus bigeumensis]